MPTTDEQVQEWERQKKIAEAKKAIVDAEKAIIDAKSAKGKAEPIEGKVETDDKFGYVSEIIGYDALRACAIEVADRINSIDLISNNDKLLIVDSFDFASGDYPLIQLEQHLRMFTQGFGLVLKTLNDLKNELVSPFEAMGIGATLGSVISTTSLIADLVGYFRVDYSVSGQDFQLSDDALKANIAKRIKKGKVFIPNFYSITELPILKWIMILIDRRIEINSLSSELQSVLKRIKDSIVETQKELAAKQEEIKKLQQGETERRKMLEGEELALKNKLLESTDKQSRLETALADWQSLSSAFDTYNKSITSSTEEQLSPIIMAAIREQIIQLGITHLLYLKVISSGGEAITKKTFWGSGETAFLGGCAVAYILADIHGNIISSDTMVSIHHSSYNIGKGDGAVVKKLRFESQNADT